MQSLPRRWGLCKCKISVSGHRNNSDVLDRRWTSNSWRYVRWGLLSCNKWPCSETILSCRLTKSRTWLKTSDNCYVAEVGLYQPGNKDILDNCGPIGFIQANWTGSKREASPSPEPITLPSSETPPQIGTDLKSHYLVNITVGEDYAFCHSCANSTCDIVGRYPYGHEVWVQCYVENVASTNPNETYWYETTDFCYVHEGDFEQSLFDRMSWQRNI